VVLNRGVSIAEGTWLMMGVYVLLAILLIILDRHTFFATDAKAPSHASPQTGR
jgi:hypothetical protein